MNDLKGFTDEEGRVKIWPAKKDKKLLILGYIAGKFETKRDYTEKEVNAVIERWHTFGDYFLIRRGLIDYGFLGRTRDGSRYWKQTQTQEE